MNSPLIPRMLGNDPEDLIQARRQAWSASGIRKKDHILDPRAGLPVRNRPAAWVSGSLESL